MLVVNVGGKLAQKFAFGVYELAAFGAFEVVVLAAFGVFAGVLIARAVAVAAREFSYLARGAQLLKMAVNRCFTDALTAFSELLKNLVRRQMAVLVFEQYVKYYFALLCVVAQILRLRTISLSRCIFYVVSYTLCFARFAEQSETEIQFQFRFCILNRFFAFVKCFL